MILELNLAETQLILSALEKSKKESLKIMNMFPLGSIVHTAHMGNLKRIENIKGQIDSARIAEFNKLKKGA